MPTQRARYMLTGTDAVEAALERARERWPEDRDRPTRVLLRLIAAGDAALAEQSAAEVRFRRAAIAATSGTLSGVYPPGYLEELRGDWPE